MCFFLKNKFDEWTKLTGICFDNLFKFRMYYDYKRLSEKLDTKKQPQLPTMYSHRD